MFVCNFILQESNSVAGASAHTNGHDTDSRTTVHSPASTTANRSNDGKH